MLVTRIIERLGQVKISSLNTEEQEPFAKLWKLDGVLMIHAKRFAPSFRDFEDTFNLQITTYEGKLETLKSYADYLSYAETIVEIATLLENQNLTISENGELKKQGGAND